MFSQVSIIPWDRSHGRVRTTPDIIPSDLHPSPAPPPRHQTWDLPSPLPGHRTWGPTLSPLLLTSSGHH